MITETYKKNYAEFFKVIIYLAKFFGFI